MLDDGGDPVVLAAVPVDVGLIGDWLGRDALVLPYAPGGGLTPALRALDPSVVISPLDVPGPWSDPTNGAEVPHLMLVSSVLALERPDLLEDVDARTQLLDALGSAATIVTFLPQVRDRLAAHVPPERVVVIPPAPRDLPDPAPYRPVMPPYVLYPVLGRGGGHSEPLDEAMSAIWATRPELKLVIVGEEGGNFEALRSKGVVYDLRSASEQELATLYGSAECLVSFDEYGASAPAVLEAMAASCPVVCRSGGSAASLVGEAAMVVPDDAWAGVLEHVGQQRDELVDAGRAAAATYSEDRMLKAWSAEIEATRRPTGGGVGVDELRRLSTELELWASAVTSFEARLEPLREVEERIEENRANALAAARDPDRPLPLGMGILRRGLRLHWRRAHRIGRLRVFDPLRPKLGWTHQHPPRPMRLRRVKSAPPSPAPAIAIATPSYNQAVYLERTIRSVLDQDYPNLEFVVQDGGSTDGSVEVIERYRERLHHAESRPDAGQAQAINLGLAKTDADIMAYLNSDDLLLPGTLDVVARYFADHPKVEAVYGHRILIDEDDLEVGRWIMPPHDDDVLLAADYVPQETLFWRRSLWDRIGGAINEERRFAMDWDLLLRFRDAGATFVRIPRFLGAFRVHAEQKTTASIDVGHEEMEALRTRYGGPTEWPRIRTHMRSYIRRHLLLHAMHRMKLLRY